MGTQISVVDYLVLDDGPPHLVAHACTSCGALYFDRRVACAKCGRTEFVDRRLGTSGTVRTFTIIHRAPDGVAVPFVSALVDLDGGGVVKANLVGMPPDEQTLRSGMRVTLTTFTAATDSAGTEAVAFAFTPGD